MVVVHVDELAMRFHGLYTKLKLTRVMDSKVRL